MDIPSSPALFLHLMKTSIDDFPFVSASRMRTAGQIGRDATVVAVSFPNCEVSFTVGVQHVRFPNGGDWAFFVCPCGRRCQKLRLFEDGLACRQCLKARGFRPRIELIQTHKRAEYLAPRLAARLNSTVPAQLHPRPGEMLERRARLELKLKRTLLVARRAKIAQFEKDLGK